MVFFVYRDFTDCSTGRTREACPGLGSELANCSAGSESRDHGGCEQIALVCDGMAVPKII